MGTLNIQRQLLHSLTAQIAYGSASRGVAPAVSPPMILNIGFYTIAHTLARLLLADSRGQRKEAESYLGQISGLFRK